MHLVVSERPLLAPEKTYIESTFMSMSSCMIKISTSPIFTLKSQYIRNALPREKLHTVREQLWGIYFSDIFVFSLTAVSGSKV